MGSLRGLKAYPGTESGSVASPEEGFHQENYTCTVHSTNVRKTLKKKRFVVLLTDSSSKDHRLQGNAHSCMSPAGPPMSRTYLQTYKPHYNSAERKWMYRGT